MGGNLLRDVERFGLVLKEAGLVKQGEGQVLGLVWVSCVGTRLPCGKRYTWGAAAVVERGLLVMWGRGGRFEL